MFVVRPIEDRDLNNFIALTNVMSSGITSLPKDRQLLEQRLHKSILSFKKDLQQPEDELYLFVLEDLTNNTLIGVCGIAAITGGSQPLYFYRREKFFRETSVSEAVREIELLTPISYLRGPSEVCSLFLHPNYRQSGLGRLLSLHRFLFIAQYPHRFTDSIVAELRGIIEPNNKSPFWSGIGQHFLNLEFSQALEKLRYGNGFIHQFLPKHPIYISLLPKEVQLSIGACHDQSKAALNMLLQEGFSLTDEIDVFDGGPKVAAHKTEIRTIKESQLLTISSIDKPVDSPLMIISNEKFAEYRACLAPIKIVDTTHAIINQDTLDALQISPTSSIRCVSPTPLR